jgi:capsular exopolysaccharide synthesis family protein
MSRFYDALREASRSQSRSQPGEPPEHEWEAIGNTTEEPLSPDVDFKSPSTVFKGSHETEPTSQKRDLTPEVDLAPAASVAEASNSRSEVTPEELLTYALHSHRGPTARSEVVGTRAEVDFDQRARLIPHAVNSVVLEHYRRLRTKILQQHEIKPFRTVVIASSAPQEGKTVTTMNLGLSFAMLPSFKVLVIDGDLRRGAIGKWLGVDNERPGLSDLIDGTAKLDDVVLGCDNTSARFIVRGNSKVSPAELLHSPRLSSQLRQMAEDFDLVLVDSAPLSLVTDAQLLASHCDAVILTAMAYETTRKSLEKAAQELNAFRIIGTVLNRGDRAKAYRRYNGYYTHD